MSRSYVSPAVRRRVAETARHRCGYCCSAEAITGAPLVIDHLIPEALGGPTVEENLWLACGQCNLHKGDRITAQDPLSGAWAPLFNLRRQTWTEHVAWAAGGELIQGITPTGRATVDALRLNRPIVVRARRAWCAAGWHPPID